MAADTFVVFVGVYASDEDAEADYQLVKELHVEEGVLDAYDAAVISKRDNGKVKITKKHETPTRVGGVMGGGVGLATGLVVALFPSPRSVEGSWPRRRGAGHSSVRSPDMPRSA